MAAHATETAPPGSTSPLSSPFVIELVKQWRAQDANGFWDKKSDEELLAPYVVTKEQRKRLPIIADPDERTLMRIELFYNAIGMVIEQRTGIIAMPMMKMHREGFGRLMLIAGRLVILNRIMRDAHRFGFESLEKMADEGDSLVETGVQMINRFQDVARYGA